MANNAEILRAKALEQYQNAETDAEKTRIEEEYKVKLNSY